MCGDDRSLLARDLGLPWDRDRPARKTTVACLIGVVRLVAAGGWFRTVQQTGGYAVAAVQDVLWRDASIPPWCYIWNATRMESWEVDLMHPYKHCPGTVLSSLLIWRAAIEEGEAGLQQLTSDGVLTEQVDASLMPGNGLAGLTSQGVGTDQPSDGRPGDQHLNVYAAGNAGVEQGGHCIREHRVPILGDRWPAAPLGEWVSDLLSSMIGSETAQCKADFLQVCTGKEVLMTQEWAMCRLADLHQKVQHQAGGGESQLVLLEDPECVVCDKELSLWVHVTTQRFGQQDPVQGLNGAAMQTAGCQHCEGTRLPMGHRRWGLAMGQSFREPPVGCWCRRQLAGGQRAENFGRDDSLFLLTLNFGCPG